MATATAVTVKRGVQQSGQGLYSEMWVVQGTVDPGSLTNGSAETEIWTVPGVAQGDVIEAISIGNASAGFGVSGQVTAANTVTMVLTNNSGGTVDLAASTWRFYVGRFY